MTDTTSNGIDSRASDAVSETSEEQNTCPLRPIGWLPELRAALSGIVLWAAFPPTGQWLLAWFALVPWFGNWVDSRGISRRRIVISSFVGGLAFWLPAVQWVRHSDPSAWAGWLVMSLALALWWPVMALIVNRLHLRNGWPLHFAWPVAWGIQEIGREYYMTGFPWYHIAHSQYRQTWLIQIADLGGASIVSVLIVAFQAWVAQRAFGGGWSWSDAPAAWRRAGFALAVLGTFTIAYGQFRIRFADLKPGPNVALLQSDVPQSRRLSPDHDQLIEIYRRLVEQALKAGEPLDLIVWPETSFPYPMIVVDPSLNESTVRSTLAEYVPATSVDYWFSNRNASQAVMTAWAAEAGVPMILGATAWDIGPSGFRKYNAAALFETDTIPQYYYKMHLVPFGEYIPWTETVPMIGDLAPFPPDQRPDLKHGDSARLLTLKNRWHMAPLICFEDTMPHVVRRFFRRSWLEAEGARVPGAAYRTVDLLMNLSNDGWFRNSEEHEVHLASSVFRCVENRRSMLRSVNTGISCVIDPNGRLLVEAAPATEQVLIRQVPIDQRLSLYSLAGDLTGLSCLVIGIVGAVVRRTQFTHSTQSPK